MSEDRREELDRWSQEHDRAVAFLLCTGAGRKLLLLSLYERFGGDLLSDREKWKVSYDAMTEVPLGSGFADIWISLIGESVVDRFSKEDYSLICEVKTGAVIAGEVIRQLRRYEQAIEKATGYDAKPRSDRLRWSYSKNMLVLAHCKPLSTAARLLLQRERIATIDLSVVEAFRSFGIEEPQSS